jgi:hypothetical protein
LHRLRAAIEQRSVEPIMPRMVRREIMHEIMKVIAQFPLGETMAWLLHTILQGQRGRITR